jgi:murein DD-endopeptidase MepM/ murein hydrolase activator NlpD
LNCCFLKTNDPTAALMNKNRQTYRIMIIPERNGNKTASFQISSVWVSFIAICFSGIIIVSVLAMQRTFLVARKLHFYEALKKDNARLAKENNQLQAVHQKFVYLDSIAIYLEQLSMVTPPAVTGSIDTKEKLKTTAEIKTDTINTHGQSVLPVDGWITQQFTNDTSHNKTAHPGIDIAATAGTKIKAPAPGVISDILQDEDYGTMVVVVHDGGFITRYGHCAKALVSVHEKIVEGQVIALVGNTGHSSAPHLHYEVIKNGKNIDPQRFVPLPEKKVKLRSGNG